jgi:hypothetical protein
MAKTHLKLVTPATKKRAVTPRRQPNSELRSREHLTETEVREDISHSYVNSIMSTCPMSVGSSSGARELLTGLDTGPHLQNIIGDLRHALA